MSLSAGTRLGPYEIVDRLGAGGMGEVYRARDTRIGRVVAVKVLPEDLERDPERRARFHKEAVAAGSLNHPNVLIVHDVGHEAGRPYLVTELLRGETLRQVIDRGPLREKTALDLGAGLLDGLAAAHALGIVHRDLKPENIFITADGVAKILDFGIARMRDGWQWHDGTGVTSAATADGMMLGSVGYMAPEQITGGETDHRADLFSAAIVVAEMTAGKAPFARPTAIETLNAIVTADPDLSSASRRVRPILERALQKDPARRFQSAADFAFALRLARAEADSPVATASRFRTWVLGAAAAVLTVAVVALAWALARRAPEAPQRAALAYRRVTFQAGKVWSARFIPGGDTIVYSASWNGAASHVFTARSDFPASVDAHLPAADVVGVSKNGEAALVLGARWLQGTEPSSGMLARSGLAGTSPRELIGDVTEADWLPDGSQLAAVRDLGRVRRLEFPLGHAVYETTGWIGPIRVSHDGSRVAFTDHSLRSDDRGDYVIADAQGKLSRLWKDVPAARGLAWPPGDRELWVCDGSRVIALAMDGTQRIVMEDLRSIALQDIGSDGRLLLASDQHRVGLSGRFETDKSERDLTWFDYSVARDLSPDGRSLLFFEAGEIAPADYLIALRHEGDAAPIKMGEGYPTSLSADGRWVLDVGLSRGSGIRVLPTGAGDVREIATPGLTDIDWATWHPDGRRIVLSAHESGRGARLYVIDGAGRIERTVGPEGTIYGWNAISPDGAQIAAQDPERRLVVYPLDGGDARPVPNAAPDERPAGWAADSASLFVVTPGVPSRISRVNVFTGVRTPWRDLLPADPTGVVRISPVIVTADGRAYAYTYGRYLSTLYIVSGAR
jgi:hypothetical protein